MKKPIIIIGLGEMGGVFSRAFLKAGYPVYPVTRNTDMQALANQVDAELVINATGENDLQASLSQMPKKWLEQCVLIQNELLPNDWLKQSIATPTVISVWFEKKPGMDFKVIVPSPAFGPHADTLKDALNTLNIAVDVQTNLTQMTFELVRKNMYILASNICGLAVQGNVGELKQKHSSLLNNVNQDLLKIQQHLTGQQFNESELFESVAVAFEGDLEHKCMGRSAPARLARALSIAQENNIEVSELQRIADTYLN